MLQRAASLASRLLPAGLMEDARLRSALSAFGLQPCCIDGPVGTLLVAAIVVALPAAIALTLIGRVFAPRAARAGPRVVLVTGASTGLGALLVDAIRVAFPDAVVYGTSRGGWAPPDDGEISASDLPLGVRQPGEPQPLLKLDVCDEASVARCVAAIKNRHGSLDALVNNAGVVLATWAKATTHEDASAQMGTNFFGAIRMARHAIPAMTDEAYKRVVVVGSIGGRLGLPFQSMYSASKAAVMVWTDALRMEVWREGVKVSLIEPGDLKLPNHNKEKAEGFDADPVAKRATDIMRAEEAEGTDPREARRRAVVPDQTLPLHPKPAMRAELTRPFPLVRSRRWCAPSSGRSGRRTRRGGTSSARTRGSSRRSRDSRRTRGRSISSGRTTASRRDTTRGFACRRDRGAGLESNRSGTRCRPSPGGSSRSARGSSGIPS